MWGVVLAFRDVSAARVSQLQIRQSEERYRSLVAAMTQTVWMTNPDFSSTVTLAGEDPSGLSDRARKEGEWLNAIHPDDRHRTKEAFDRASTSKTVYEVEHRVKSPDGGFRHFLVRAVPLLDSAGSIREWIGTSSDITERREAEEARERLYREVKENNKRKDEFLAMLAHELMSSRVESSRVESSRVESCRVESSRVESSRVESSRVESSRVESSRVESSRVESSAWGGVSCRVVSCRVVS